MGPNRWLTQAGCSTSASRYCSSRNRADAEAALRECLTTLQSKNQDMWQTFAARSLLGQSLLGQKKYAAAEPLLLQGYEGIKHHQAAIPPQAKSS